MFTTDELDSNCVDPNFDSNLVSNFVSGFGSYLVVVSYFGSASGPLLSRELMLLGVYRLFVLIGASSAGLLGCQVDGLLKELYVLLLKDALFEANALGFAAGIFLINEGTLAGSEVLNAGFGA